jgi:hypothetical protein
MVTITNTSNTRVTTTSVTYIVYLFVLFTDNTFSVLANEVSALFFFLFFSEDF